MECELLPRRCKITLYMWHIVYHRRYSWGIRARPEIKNPSRIQSKKKIKNCQKKPLDMFSVKIRFIGEKKKQDWKTKIANMRVSNHEYAGVSHFFSFFSRRGNEPWHEQQHQSTFGHPFNEAVFEFWGYLPPLSHPSDKSISGVCQTTVRWQNGQTKVLGQAFESRMLLSKYPTFLDFSLQVSVPKHLQNEKSPNFCVKISDFFNFDVHVTIISTFYLLTVFASQMTPFFNL